MKSNNDYFDSIGVKDENEAFTVVRDYCFLQNENPLNEQVKTMLMACIANNINPRMSEIYDEYLDGDFEMNGIVIPTLRIRGWYRLADASGRIRGVEFIYSDDDIVVESNLGCAKWIEAQIWLDSNERPITARVFAAERIQFGGSWHTMPNQRLEQSAYIAAIGRALGVRGIYDSDSSALLKASELGRSPTVKEAPGSAVEPEPNSACQEEVVQSDCSEMGTPEAQHSTDCVQACSSSYEEQFVSVDVGVNYNYELLPSNEHPEVADVVVEEVIPQHQDNSQAVEVEPEVTISVEYRPSQKDKLLLRNLIAGARSSGAWEACADYIDTQPYSEALRNWLSAQIRQEQTIH